MKIRSKTMDPVITIKGKTALRIQVQANARKTAFAGFHEGMVKLKVAAPPLEGKANKAVTTYLAHFFGVAKDKVQLVRGERSRQKTLILAGLREEEVYAKLPGYSD